MLFYSPDRKGERPASHLVNFTGTLHADAYAGYKNLYKSDKYPDNKITEAACWAHTRRKFYEITFDFKIFGHFLKNDPFYRAQSLVGNDPRRPGKT